MREAFERAILDNPDEPANFAAYADWLADQGDPRGEFMQAQLALEDERRPAGERTKLKEREAALLAAHQADWLRPLAPLLLAEVEEWEEVPNYEWRFARGFLDSLHVPELGLPLARALRDAPQTRFLRELVIELVGEEGMGDEEDGQVPFRPHEPGPDYPTLERDNIQFGSIFPLIQTPEFTNLRYLRIGDDKNMDECLTARYGISHHTYCNPAGLLVARMPRLEELHLLCKDFDPEPVFSCRTLTNLRVLRVYHLGIEGREVWHRGERDDPEFPLDVLGKNPALANLTHLLFHPHQEERGSGSFLPLEQVEALLASKRLKRLTHLQLRLSDMGDEGCQAIVSSGILKRLRWLDLRHGCVTDDGARILASCPDLRNLDHLDLCRNGLTEHGISALRATGVPLRADYQQTEQELADEQYLREGDFE
jgi:uncharacterized protein (TIGR02996 family)